MLKKSEVIHRSHRCPATLSLRPRGKLVHLQHLQPARFAIAAENSASILASI
jgi:hypothetical protein